MRLTKDHLAGLLFLFFGLGAIIVAQGYSIGTLARMGSGYFPTMIGGLISLLGFIVLVRAIIKPESSEPMATIELRPMLFISAAIITFGILVDQFGIIPALASLIIIGRFAGREGTAIEVAMMVLVLTGVVIAIFVYGLNIRLNLGPW
jgi:hypothetical protein